jgi:Spy/CpxP family protein refolding chaperone
MADEVAGTRKTVNRSPSRLVIGAILAAHLLAGAAAGIALDRFVLHRRHMTYGEFGAVMDRGPGRPNSSDLEKRLADRITNELSLTPDQRTRLDSILPRHTAAFDSLRREMRSRLRALVDSSSAEVEAILTPEQRAKWAEIRQRLKPPAPPRPTN